MGGGAVTDHFRKDEVTRQIYIYILAGFCLLRDLVVGPAGISHLALLRY